MMLTNVNDTGNEFMTGVISGKPYLKKDGKSYCAVCFGKHEDQGTGIR